MKQPFKYKGSFILKILAVHNAEELGCTATVKKGNTQEMVRNVTIYFQEKCIFSSPVQFYSIYTQCHHSAETAQTEPRTFKKNTYTKRKLPPS